MPYFQCPKLTGGGRAFPAIRLVFSALAAVAALALGAPPASADSSDAKITALVTDLSQDLVASGQGVGVAVAVVRSRQCGDGRPVPERHAV